MQIFNETPVLESEIDRLGHMNVQYYMVRAGNANTLLMQSLGLTPQICETHNAILRQADVYCRFHREQFAGATLQVLGGLLEMDDRRAKAYFEIRNPANDELAASFIIENALVTAPNRSQIKFPEMVTGTAKPAAIQVPAYAAPRTLKLDSPRVDVTLAELQARVVDLGPMGMMSGQFERVVDATECDSYGYFREGGNLMFGGKRPEPDEDGSFGPPVLVTDEGHRFGWAILETRSMVLGTPRAEDVLSSIGADISLAAKSRHSRRWTFDTNTQELLAINDAVAVALDLDERRAIEIPDSMRRVIEQNHLPEYA